jgi:hypothetical protein
VDGQTIEQFEADLKSNLYKIWNRMSSGSYFPPPVRAVSIPKKSGGQRILGVPTVADRVAQMVAKQVIEPILDPVFLADSYGYRPRKSTLDAVGVTRERCWKYDWVLEVELASNGREARRFARHEGFIVGIISEKSESRFVPSHSFCRCTRFWRGTGFSYTTAPRETISQLPTYTSFIALLPSCERCRLGVLDLGSPGS